MPPVRKADGEGRAATPTGLELHLGIPGREGGSERSAELGKVEARRLQFWLHPSATVIPPNVVSRLRAYNDALFVVDTSYFDAEIDLSVWFELVSRSSQVVVAAQVREELNPWLAKHPMHPAARAVEDGQVRLGDVSTWSSATQDAFLYYVNVLGIRKHLYRAAEIQLEGELGRAPTADEILRCKQELSSILGPRAIMLARKGAKNEPKRPASGADEVVIVTAFFLAIQEERPVVVLTRDQDLLELFYKMQWLLDTQYRAWFLASRYLATPEMFSVDQMPSGPPWSDAFAGDANLLIPWSDADPEAVRSTYAVPIPVECWLLRDTEIRAGFAVEAAMEQLIDAKGTTGGLNHAALSPRNLHIWLAPLPIPQDLRANCALVTDLRLELPETNIAIPVHDLNQSILTEENGVRRNR